MTPVVLLTDAYIANGSAAWRLPDLNTYPSICPPYVKLEMADSWTPFQRDPQTGVRYWATPVPRALCTVSEDWKRVTKPEPFLRNRKTTS